MTDMRKNNNVMFSLVHDVDSTVIKRKLTLIC